MCSNERGYSPGCRGSSRGSVNERFNPRWMLKPKPKPLHYRVIPDALPMNAFVDVSFFPRDAKPLTSYRKYWAQRFGTAPFLPMSRSEMTQLGWDSCDIVLVTGDAYVDHPSFGLAGILSLKHNRRCRRKGRLKYRWRS